jgi:hypothetical protein
LQLAAKYLNCHCEESSDVAVSFDIEHDFLVGVQKLLNEKLNNFVSLNELRTLVESKLRESGDEIIIEL